MNKNKEIRSAGLKVTHGRRAILRILENDKSTHLSADDIHKKLLEDSDEVGIATIYRVLNQFVTAGICIRHNFETGQSLYELTPDHHHDHMVCLSTGKVIEFEDELIENRQEEVAAKKGYRIVDHSLVLYVEPLEK
jgi:Fur family ferric uptake transcriptional regulator